VIVIPASVIPAPLPTEGTSCEATRVSEGAGPPFSELLAAVSDAGAAELHEHQPPVQERDDARDDVVVAIAAAPLRQELHKPVATVSSPTSEVTAPSDSLPEVATTEVPQQARTTSGATAKPRERQAPVPAVFDPVEAASGSVDGASNTVDPAEMSVDRPEVEPVQARPPESGASGRQSSATPASVFASLGRKVTVEVAERRDVEHAATEPVALARNSGAASIVARNESVQTSPGSQSRPDVGQEIAPGPALAVRPEAVVDLEPGNTEPAARQMESVEASAVEPTGGSARPETGGTARAMARVQQVATTLASLVADKLSKPAQDEVESPSTEKVETIEAPILVAREVPQQTVRNQSMQLDAPAAPVRVRPAPEAPPSATRFVILPFDAPDGGTGMLRVSVMGDVVRATMVADAATAMALERGLPELRRALDARGFGDTQLSVRSIGESQSLSAAAPRSPEASEHSGFEAKEHHQGEHADARDHRERRRQSRREDLE
jgi:hypothetical protein